MNNCKCGSNCENGRMKSSDYILNSERTNSSLPETVKLGSHTVHLIHAAFGLSSEVGEFVDNLKRHIFYGTEIDYANMEEELGDICWYMALALREINSDFETIMHKNINKLMTRYPEKFDPERAVNRNTDLEKEALRG